jgi:hypothetical protein
MTLQGSVVPKEAEMSIRTFVGSFVHLVATIGVMLTAWHELPLGWRLDMVHTLTSLCFEAARTISSMLEAAAAAPVG